MAGIQWQSNQIKISEDAEPIEQCYQNGWTDGLPVVPPTPDRVERMLSGTQRKPEELVAQIPPKWGRATIERIAINAVMAGCKPEYLPVVIAALEAITADPFNLHGVQVTTSLVSPLLIINGPIRKQLDINGSFNVFGQGWRANATIGRAVRLICTNIGGALPGELDRATFGHAGKYTFCVAENEEVSPWQPLHIERGFQSSQSTVTVFAGASPESINDHSSNTAAGILNTVCRSIATPGMTPGEIILVISPEHAKTISADGFSRDDIQQYVHENTKVTARHHDQISTRNPEDVIIVVAGGPAGRWTMAIAGWGGPTRSVTKPIAA
ncbi:MAG: hypothetical protein O7E52_11730 [Candidatus Poribacteria bacterium]|nr:hypothetical protein [Candidatus Poribacteria bacterium]